MAHRERKIAKMETFTGKKVERKNLVFVGFCTIIKTLKWRDFYMALLVKDATEIDVCKATIKL